MTAPASNGNKEYDDEYSSVIEIEWNRNGKVTEVVKHFNFDADERITSTMYIDVFQNQSDTEQIVHIDLTDKVVHPGISRTIHDIEQDDNQENTEVTLFGKTASTIQENIHEAIRSETKYACSVRYCTQSSRPFHYFCAILTSSELLTENLQKLWVQLSGNLELLNIPSVTLHKRHFICDAHFSDKQFYSASRKRLLRNAVPDQMLPIKLPENEMNKFPKLRVQDYIKINHTDNENESMKEIDTFQKKFEDIMGSITERTCGKCKETFIVKGSSRIKCVHGANCKDYTDDNEMDPDEVPEALKDLTYIEEQLIALHHPQVTVFKLKRVQYGHRGNVINFPQNLKGFASKLPHRLDELSSVLTVRVQNNDVDHVDFRVRGQKVKKALLWLKNNNDFYRDIEISTDNLDILPADGNVYNNLSGIDIEECSTDDNEENISCVQENEDQITESVVPMLGDTSEQDYFNNIMGWPSLGEQPVNEFSHVGFIAKAFPTLFPYGHADLRAPRNRQITATNYFRHLMRYKDKRFAQHPRFRYYAFNSEMRWRALKNGGVYVKKNEEFQDVSADYLKQKLEENPSLIKKNYGSNLQGTRAFWFSKGKQLLAMFQQLKLPTLFFTLSSADMHWPELFKILAPDKDYNSLTSKERENLLQNNPMIADQFFHERVESFLKEVVIKKYKVKDYWYRTEYQHRGSPHVHGVLWLEGAPDVLNLPNATVEERDQIAQYFDELVSAFHPSLNTLRPSVHPSRKKLSEVEDLEEDLCHLLNSVQMHSRCSQKYCLRKNKKTKKIECRFKFPKDHNDQARIVITPEGDIEFIPKRNNPILNKCNFYMLQTWRANIDVAPVVSKRALLLYLTKYITKSENISAGFETVMNLLLDQSQENCTAKQIIQRFFIQMCCERDYSAQEVCHSLMGTKMTSAGGRIFVNLYFKFVEENWIELECDEKKSKSFIEKYAERPNEFESFSLWKTAQMVNLPSNKIRRKTAIVQIFPQYKFDKNSENNEFFYKQQVMLFLPWRDIEVIKQNNETWENIYNVYIDMIKKNQETCLLLNDTVANEEEYETEDFQKNNASEEWMFLSEMTPKKNPQKAGIGKRQIDLEHNWHESTKLYDKYGGIASLRSFLTNVKANDTVANETSSISQDVHIPNITFTGEQQNILDYVEFQLNWIKHNSDSHIGKKVIVQGKAGTGKSLVIAAIVRRINEVLGSGSVLVLGPTGICALNVNGSTIHSKLQIDTKNFKELKGPALCDFVKSFESVRFIIIDEYSMVGCKFLHYIDQRLKKIKQSEEDFGNVFLWMFGDVQQLPPVFDSACYSLSSTCKESDSGKLLYRNFDFATILTQVKRQNCVSFQETLNNISTGNVQKADFDLLETRFKTSVSAEEKKRFEDAVHIFPTRKQVSQFNEDKLETLKHPVTNDLVPITIINAKHNCSKAETADPDKAEGLEQSLYAAEGAKIMLRNNLWTERGLVNGACGTIKHILYEEESNPETDMPSILICHFESYKGPYIDDEQKTVPITPVTKHFKYLDADCSRTQFPIAIAYACTIHKSQGLTLSKIFVNIGNSEKPGLAYTALSRVKILDDMLIEPFPIARLEAINTKMYMKWRVEWIDFLQRKSLPLIPESLLQK
ncbi:LOW QUALITY PROTEIN: ATP-dependent DNA helicase pfh1 [Frankliniella fusca]|uniref:ATP-dependent DNA helicase n=1 Tax=Frankliniella fusca TaxID=407009 RepID=A0AAE1LNJ9_9NEOP|nr:LOW QUALITY PROTEIN: ATP-dependent DNA helicase pfh1 [Frankliniella fusca]